MTFTVEDGTGVVDANAYTTEAFVDDYFSDRGIATWTGTSTVKQQAIVKATDYMDKRFGNRVKGITAFPGIQATVMPTTAFTLIPTQWQRACAEYALRALTAPLAPDPTVEATNRTVSEEKKVVGPIEKTIKYEAGKQTNAFRSYPEADALMKPFLKNNRRVIR